MGDASAEHQFGPAAQLFAHVGVKIGILEVAEFDRAQVVGKCIDQHRLGLLNHASAAITGDNRHLHLQVACRWLASDRDKYVLQFDI